MSFRTNGQSIAGARGCAAMRIFSGQLSLYESYESVSCTHKHKCGEPEPAEGTYPVHDSGLHSGNR